MKKIEKKNILNSLIKYKKSKQVINDRDSRNGIGTIERKII